MKNNFFGYIFILFIIFIMGFAIYKVKVEKKDDNSNNNTSKETSSEVKKSTDITLAISEFDTINPIITNNKKVQDIDRIIFEPLINISEDYKLEYLLAKECVKSSGNSYIIKLRPAVKWSDGSKFTSDDVKFTIDKLKENENSVYSKSIKAIKEVDIIDNYTLKIILSQDIPNFEYYLSFPILSNSYYQGTDFWNTENKMPITTGEFKISEATGNTIVLNKNKLWWNKEKNSTIEKITINIYSSVAEMYNAFKMGNIDLITTKNQNFQNYVGTIGYDKVEIEDREFIFLALNTKDGVLSDKNVRKAVRSAIDKNRVIENSYGNMLYKPTNFILNTGNYLVDNNNEEFYNLEEKNNILQSIGFEYRNGTWQRQVDYRWTELSMNLVVRANDSIRCKAAENIKNQLGEQGISVNIIYADDNLYNSYLNNMNYDMMLCSIYQPIAPDLSTYFGYNNLANFYNQELEEIVNVIKNTTDEKELKTKFQRIYEIYNEEVPYIGIARNKTLAIKNTNLIGEIKANWYSMFYNFDSWYKISD